MSERPVAAIDALTEPWWEATRHKRLMVQRCDACGKNQLYPRALCTACWSTSLRYVEASGRGVVLSFTVVHRAPHEFFDPPYAVALVRLDEGPVVVTNFVGADASCDQPVEVTWEPLSDGRNLPLFAPRK